MATLFYYLVHGLFISSTDFTKQDAVKQAEVLGVSVKTIEVWLQKYVQSSHIERVMHGSYRKAICKTA